MHCIRSKLSPDPFARLGEIAVVQAAAVCGNEKISEALDLDRIFDGPSPGRYWVTVPRSGAAAVTHQAYRSRAQRNQTGLRAVGSGGLGKSDAIGEEDRAGARVRSTRRCGWPCRRSRRRRDLPGGRNLLRRSDLHDAAVLMTQTKRYRERLFLIVT